MTATEPIERTCEHCGRAFLIPAAERAFRRERGLQDPVACPDCRLRSRAARNADLIAVHEKSDLTRILERGSDNGRNASSRTHGSRAMPPRQRYNTVCDSCGAETQVPFVPRGDRPVYCRDCFNARKGR